MPPVPIHIKSPINAAKAAGVTPQTDASGSDPVPAQLSPTPASGVVSDQGYPAAQPGAAPSLPAPTGSTSSRQYVPVQPTPTQKEYDSGPPPPQPGAVPLVPGMKTSAPRPPRFGEQSVAPPPDVTAALSYPPQMTMPTPSIPYLQRGTATATTPSGVLPGEQFVHLSGQHDASSGFSHPPGYQQNPNASELSGSQRAAQVHLANSGGSFDNASFNHDDDSVWNSAKKLVQVAGEKLSAAEGEVWRRINKE